MKRRLTLLIFVLFCASLSLSAQDKYKFGSSSFKAKASTFQEHHHDDKKKVLKLYPVPATRQITFELKDNPYGKTYEITVYNFLGKSVDKMTGFNDKKTLNLEDYYSGIYIYQLRDKHGHLVESGKFNVVK